MSILECNALTKYYGGVQALTNVDLTIESGRIVGLLREAGAAQVHMRVSSPPFIAPCYYGTDVDSKEHLIACRCTVSEIAREIGADSLGYLPLEALAETADGPAEMEVTL